MVRRYSRRVPAPLRTIAILAIPIAVVMAFLPIGLALGVLVVLILFGAIAKGVARSSDTGRWVLTGVYFGALAGFVIAILRAT